VVAWLLGCLVAWLVGWLVGCLVAWLLGWLVGWLVGWLLAVVGAAGIEMVSHIRGRRYRDGFAHLGAAGIEMVLTEESLQKKARQKKSEQGLRFLHQVAIQNLLKNCPGKILPNFGARPNCKIFVQIIHKWAKLLGKIAIRYFL